MTLKSSGFVSSLALMTALASPAYAQDQAQPENQTPSGNASTQVTTTTQGQATAGNPNLQTSGNETNTTNEIVVTAEFRAASLQNTPIAITAVNGAMLDQRGQTDIAQVAAQAPNVTLSAQPQTGGIGLIAFIRGVGQTDFDYALEPGVGIYVDDVYIPTLSSSLLNIMDVDRIEILRGPQGVLGGKNSIGGSIKLFSKKPEGSNTGYLEAGYGSFNELHLRGMADIRISDTLSARVSGVATSHDGWVDIVDYGLSHPNSNVPANNARGHYKVVGHEGSQNMQAGRFALRWQPASNIDVNISADYTNEKDSPVPDILIAAGRPGPTASNPNPFDPSVPLAATNVNGGPWLPGRDGTAVPYDCHFVPFGQYSCDTGADLPSGIDRRYMTYANFLDAMAPTQQAPYKPYAALQNSDFKGWGVMGDVQWDISDAAKITWISSYRKYQSNFSQDQDASPVAVAQLDNQLNHNAWSQELRLGGDLGNGFFDYTLGGFYMKQRARYTARVDLNYAGIDFVHGPDLTPSSSKALFFNGTIHPTDAWSVSGGVRRSWDKKVYTYFRSNPDGTVPFVDQPSLLGPGFPPVCEFFVNGTGVFGPTSIGNTPNCLLTGLYGVQGSFKGSRWDWRAVTDYRFSPEFLAYASISTGYMGGGVNPRPFFGPSTGECPPVTLDSSGHVIPSPPCNQIKPFKPETLTTYEVGFKSDLFDRRLRLNGAAFYNKFNDIILTLSACPSTPCIQPRNVGKATVKGFELEIEAHPAAGFEIDGSLSYIDFKYNKASVAPAGLNGSETTPYTPKWTWSLGAQYDYRMANDSTFGIRLDGAYQSKIFSETFNDPWGRIPGRFLANGRIYYKSPGDEWQLSLEVKNIFNKYYFVTKEDVTTSLGAVLGQPGMPRTWLLSLRRNFGAPPPPPPPPAPAPVAAPPPPPPPPPAPVPTYKQCLDNSVVPIDQACPAPPPPAVAPQGERG
jgi:iron complex outermembrane receptor protein